MTDPTTTTPDHDNTAGITIERPDDETIEIHLDGNVVATANHDEHGWSGMDAVERTALAVGRAFATRIATVRANLTTAAEQRAHAITRDATTERDLYGEANDRLRAELDRCNQERQRLADELAEARTAVRSLGATLRTARTELERARTTIATLTRIATDAARLAGDIADGKLTNNLGPDRRPPHDRCWTQLRATQATIDQHQAEWANLRHWLSQYGDDGQIPAAALRQLLRDGPGPAIPGHFNHDPDCGCTPPCGHGTYQAAAPPPASVPSPARAGSPAGPSQGQEIPDEQLHALMREINGYGEFDGELSDAELLDDSWTQWHRHAARQAYRVGYAAALGCPVTIAESGDRLEIGDRPEQTDPEQGAPCGRCWACLATDDVPLARVVEAAVALIAAIDAHRVPDVDRLERAVRQLLAAPACVDLSVPAVSIAETAAEDQGDDAEPEQRQRRRIGLTPRVRAALDTQETAGSAQ